MDAINWNAARFFFDAIQLAGIIAIGIYSWWISHNRAHAVQLDELNTKINQNEQQIAEIKKDIDRQPGHDEIQSLRKEIGELRTEMAETRGTLNGVNKFSDLLNEYLINRASP